jgi:hypothetical protein
VVAFYTGHTSTQQNDQIKCVVGQLQPGVVSQLLRLALAANLTTPATPGWLELANDAFYLIGSPVFRCME